MPRSLCSITRFKVVTNARKYAIIQVSRTENDFIEED